MQYGNVNYGFEYKLKDKDGNLQAIPKDTKKKDFSIVLQYIDENINFILKKKTFEVGSNDIWSKII